MSAILPIILYIMGTIYNFFPYTKRSCLHNWSFGTNGERCILYLMCWKNAFMFHVSVTMETMISNLPHFLFWYLTKIMAQQHSHDVQQLHQTAKTFVEHAWWLLCLKNVGVPHGFSQFVAQAPQCLPPRISSARYSPLCSCSAVSSGNVYLQDIDVEASTEFGDCPRNRLAKPFDMSSSMGNNATIIPLLSNVRELWIHLLLSKVGILKVYNKAYMDINHWFAQQAKEGCSHAVSGDRRE